MIRLADDVLEQHRATTVEVLLKCRQFEVRIDRLVGLQQVAFSPQPFESAAQIDNQIGHVAQNFLLCSAHKSSPCLVPVGHVNRWLGRVGAALIGGGNTHTHD